MTILVKVLGIIAISVAILFLIRPKTIQQFMGFWLEGKNIYLGGVLRLIIGAFLLFAASECRFAVIVIVLGIINVASGIAVFFIGLERAKKILTVISEKGDLIHRLIALVPLAVGILLVYAA